MTSYLYDDGNGLKTSAREEASLGKPITDVSNMVKTKNGLWIPQTGTEDGAANVQVAGSDVMLPTQMQAKLSTTIQTHTNTAVTMSGTNTSPYQDISGFTDIVASMTNSANATCTLELFWSHDGVNLNFVETILASGARANGYGTSKRKARFVAVKLTNGDAAAGKTMNSWLDLTL
jgi:hypothetical protein